MFPNMSAASLVMVARRMSTAFGELRRGCKRPMLPDVSAASLVMAVSAALLVMSAAALGATRMLDMLVLAPIFSPPSLSSLNSHRRNDFTKNPFNVFKTYPPGPNALADVLIHNKLNHVRLWMFNSNCYKNQMIPNRLFSKKQ
jgi:hypothetical protein